MNQNFDLVVDISEYDFSKEALSEISNNQWVKNQWPLVYFIQNQVQKIAYVGESTNAFNRLNNHLANDARSILNKVSIIGSDKFNKSATLDIESQLIQYIASEGTYTLQNGNNGLVHHNYYQRDLYGNLFQEVWNKLKESNIVNKTLDEIQNSDFFKYSPYKSLSQDQFNSVLEIVENLNKRESNHIFVKGSAGTGKTILATYLIKLLNSRHHDLNVDEIDDDNYREIELLKEFREKYPHPKIGLVIAMTSLRETLENVFAKVPGLNKSMVLKPTETFNRKYDILIIDEAHRLRQRRNIGWMGAFTEKNKLLGLGNEGTELDWIIANSKHQIFFYDAAQSVKPSDVPKEKFDLLLNKPSTVNLELKSQMRVNAGADYITFVDKLLHCNLNDTKIDFEALGYDFRVFDSIKEMYEILKQKEKEHQLCRMVAGYSWPWETAKKEPSQNFDIEIQGMKLRWNNTTKDWINTENAFEEVGCIHTVQGYDLNYVAVIFGEEIIYNPRTNVIEIIKENYYDKNGKNGITDPEELKAYIINIYKTMLYRGIKGTFIYACDKNLSNYLKNAVHGGKELKYTPKILPLHEVNQYKNSVPIYDVQIAAGKFSELQHISDFEWVELPEPFTPRKDYFVCQVIGESMNRKIPNGSWCLFKKDPGGTREGKIVLVEHYDIQEADFGAGFTIKEYHSKKYDDGEFWEHESITLKPLSYDDSYQEIKLVGDENNPLKVVGVFVCVLE